MDERVFETLDWDEYNTAHAGRHGLTPEIAMSVLVGSPRFFENREDEAGSHVMIGPAEGGRFWTVVILQINEFRGRPITGWPSTAKERRLHQED